MKYGLSEKQLKEIVDIISSYEEIEEAILFGSRAIDTYKEASDVDIAIKGGNVNWSLAAKLKDHFEEETYLPFFFDFIAYPTITNEELKKHIRNKGKVIYLRGMGEWKETSLNKIVELIGGGTPKTSITEYWNGDIPWLSVADFNTGRKYVYNTEKSLTSLGLEKSSTKLLQEGDSIISARGRGTVGVVAMLGRKMAFNQSCYGVRAKEGESNNDYIFYLLKYAVNNLQQISHGGVFDTITRDTFKEIDIFLPPLPEQKAIASLLSSLDDKIDLLHRQNKTLEAMAATLFRQWFVEEAQEDWEAGCLGDVLELAYGKGLKKDIRTGAGYPVIGPSGIVDYHSNFLVEGPGIVIGRKGTLGKVIYLWDNFFPIDTTYYIKPKVESAGLLYEYFLLKTLNFEEMNSDSAVPGLNRDIALSTAIKIAPLEMLHKFNKFTLTFIDKLRENTKQIRILEKLRDTLLLKLMNGEIRVEYEN